jgi:hypothetical protein
MKKTILIIAVAFAYISVVAQSDTGGVRNRRGQLVLPEKGDVALGFNMIPVLDAILGAINPATTFTGTGNMVQYTQVSNNQVTGKYYLDPQTAIRVRFGINTVSGSVTNRVQDADAMYKASLGTADDIAAAALLRVEDKVRIQKNNLLVSVGFEKRRGHRRLQGFYGAELGFGNEGARQSTTYGNAFSDQHPVYYTNFTTMTTVTVNPTLPGRAVRNTETVHRGALRVGLRGFVGVEYFIFAKISIAAEYGWGYSIARRRAATSKQEVYNNGQNGPQVFTEEVKTDSREIMKGFAVDNNNGSAFSVDNTIGGNTSLTGGAGALTLLFHF